jgi:hypothetical protein
MAPETEAEIRAREPAGNRDFRAAPDRARVLGWTWAISGMILAVPILATFKIFCDHIEPMTPIAEFIS